MKRLIGTLAAAALLVLPLNAMAQSHGGTHGSFAGHSYAGGSWHGGGGWRGGGFRHGYGYPFFGGLALGFGLGYPWYYWGDPYWYWGPYPYWYDGYDYYYGPPPATTSPPTACGAWVWHGDQNRYQWVPAPCAAPAPSPPPAS